MRPDIKLILLILTFPSFLASLSCRAQTEDVFVISRISYNEREHIDDRGIWYDKILYLALEKTKPKYGPYRYQYIPYMEFARALHSMRINRYENLFTIATYSQNIKDNNLAHIPFPTQLGLLGYRVCFYPKQHKNEIEQAITSGMLKSLRIGQGRDWFDARVLKYNGYKVVTANGYEELFHMTEARRFDLFCRGLSEVFSEYSTFKDSMDIDLEDSFAFHYPFPIFFYTNKQNTLLRERLYEGLTLAFNDGSLLSLFTEHHAGTFKLTEIWKRKIIRLNNPYINELPKDYEQYNFDIDSIQTLIK